MCLDVGSYSFSFCHKYFSISSCLPLPPDSHGSTRSLCFILTSVAFWALILPTSPPDTFKVIKSSHSLLWKKNQNIWVLASVSFFLCLCFLNLFGSGHDWKSRFPSWWIPQLWMFLRFSCTGCWATLTRPWFFQERLDHRIIEATLNLVLCGCMELVKNATVILNPIFYWHNSMIPLAHSPTETGELHGLLFAHYIF